MKTTKYVLPVKVQSYVSGCEYYFACNLRRLRLSRSPRLTQGRLAQKLGVTRNTYAGYESGKRLPPAWFVHCTADYFKVTADELIGQELRKEEINSVLDNKCSASALCSAVSILPPTGNPTKVGMISSL